MKKYLLFAAAFVLMISCNNQANKTKTTDEENAATKTELSANLESICFDVEGMTCEGCENAIKKNVRSIPGVAEVSASHTEKNTIVKYDPAQTNPDEISKAITGTGYKVTGSHAPADKE